MRILHALAAVLVVLAVCQCPLPLRAQQGRFVITGSVVDDDGQPIEMANVVLNRALGVTTLRDGSFAIKNVPAGEYTWTISFVGFETATGTIAVSTGKERLDVKLHELNLGLEEVTVTARQQKLGSASEIGQEAIRHLQPKSVGDMLQLLPGNLTVNPNLNDMSQAQIREIGSNAANAMGTQIVVDGAPVSNDANLELLSFAVHGTSADGNGATVGAHSTAGRGTDLRTISAGVVETMEVIRGIPGVEYGNLTSGVVIVNTKSGYTPLEVKLQADPNSKLAYVGKGFRLKSGGAVNVSADWAQSWADTRKHYEGYDRVTANVGYSRQLGNVSLNVRGAFFTSINDTKRDPQMTESYSEWKNDNTGGRLALTGTWTPAGGWLQSVAYKVSGALSRQKDWKSTWIYNPDGIITSSRQNGVAEARFKRYGYNSEYEIESIPYNIYAQLIGTHYHSLAERGGMTLRGGVEYTLDGNRGHGLTYDEENPPQAMSAHRLRPRADRDIPALQTLSAFVSDRASLRLGTMNATVEAGVRASGLLLDSEKSGGNDGYFVVEPRVNASLDVLTTENNSVLDNLSLTGGFGLSNKMPPLLYLYPDATYYDHFALSRWTDNEADRLALVQTTVVDATQNPDLKPVRSRKWEVGLTAQRGGWNATATFFHERHKNELGSETQLEYIRYPLYTVPEAATSPRYDATTQTVTYTLDGQTATAERNYYTARVTWSRPANTTRSEKHGIEYTLSTPEWHAIRTQLNVTGAWFYIKRRRMSTSLTGNVSYDDRTMHVSPYAVVLPGGSGSINTRFNSNFAFITHIPQLKMVFTTTVQVVWRQTSKAIYEDLDGNSLYYLKSYSDKDYMVVNPLGYYDMAGDYHEWSPTDADDVQLNLYMARAQTYDLLKDVVDPWAMVNMRLTKEIGRTAEISFTANNLTNTHKLRTNKNSNTLYQVYPSMYFGAEVKLKF